MNAFSKRYFVCIALIFLIFTAISFDIKKLIFFPIFTLSVTVFYFILSKNKQKHKNLKLVTWLMLGAAILGVACSCSLQITNNKKIEKYSGEHTITGYVKEVSSSYSFMSEYVVRVERIDGKKVNFDAVLTADYQCDLYRGDFFSFNGKISPLETYNDFKYLKNNNTYDYPLLCEIDEKTEIELLDDEFRVSLMLSKFNSKLSSTLKSLLGADNGSLASALLLGNRELLSDTVLRDFKRAGVYHMLALSGLHVAILIGVLDKFMIQGVTRRIIRIIILTLLSLFYVALTGFTLSACRSILMLWVIYLAYFIKQWDDPMSTLFLAVSVIVLLKPSAILDVGLQLSFLSTFGVISASIICEKLDWFRKSKNDGLIKYFLLSSISKLFTLNVASVCVFVFTLPVLAVCFGEVSLATFISNIFLGFLCEVFMIFSLLLLLFSWSPILRFPFAEISARVGDLITKSVSSVSDWDNVMLSLSYPKIEFLIWGLFISFLILFAIKLNRKYLIFIPCIAFAILLPINISFYKNERDDFVRAEYIKSDNLILSSGTETYICDLSNGSYGNFYESINIAKENCFTEINGIILTHYHSEHIISLQRLTESFKIYGVFMPLPQNDNEDSIMRSIIRILNDEGVTAYIYENDCELEILSGKLSVSPRAYVAGYAHPSVALSFAYGNDRLTLLGKPYFSTHLEKSAIFKKYIENCDFLIFGDDGLDVKDGFEIFAYLKNGCEISFSDFDLMDKSDFEEYMDEYKIYFDVDYKKYDLK